MNLYDFITFSNNMHDLIKWSNNLPKKRNEKDRAIKKKANLIKKDYKDAKYNTIIICTSSYHTANSNNRKITKNKNAENIKDLYKEVIANNKNFFENEFAFFKRIHPRSDNQDKTLPNNSILINVSFELETPYISRDDTSFYIIDNPIRKEWVFKIPYIAASQWKGMLESALIQEFAIECVSKSITEDGYWQRRLQLWRLFGNENEGTQTFLNKISTNIFSEKENEKGIEETLQTKLAEKGLKKDRIEGFKGILFFYSTFFSSIGLEVINPHDRKKGSGDKPILMECVPENTNGKLKILYCPFETVNTEKLKADLKLLAEGIRALFIKYGIGAKTSSGYGRARFEASDLKLNFSPYPEKKEIKELETSFKESLLA